MQQRTQLIPESTGGFLRGCGGVLLIIFIVIFATLFIVPLFGEVYGAFRASTTEAGLLSLNIEAFVIGVIVLGVPLYLIVRWVRLRRYIAQRVHPTVFTSNHPLRMGEQFTIDCTFPRQSETEILAGSMTLILREAATYETWTGTQSSSTTVTHDYAFGVCPIPHIAAAGGASHNLTWNGGIPLTAMHTFEASNNKIRWYVAFDIQVRVGKRTRKYSARFPVLVLPQIVGA